MPSRTDRKVADRYALQQPLGRGGMGTVWRGRDEVLQRAVAIKEIRLPETLSESDRDSVRERVMREARTAARLNHPNVVTVFDVVKEDGHAYIVMELVDAPTLHEVVTRDGALSPQRTATIGLGVLAALRAAHAEGITHRDVKPANVMLPSGGRAKLADFGIAALKGDPKLTATGLILGSPSFMAPEQASHDVTGPTSDLWSLGATLYHAVEGEPPFDRGSALPTLTAVVHDEPRELRRAGPLTPVIEALLAKDPDDRPSAPRVQHMLEEVAGGSIATRSGPTEELGSGTATRVYEPAPAPARAVEGNEPRVAPDRPSSQRRSGPWLVALGLMALLALAALLILPNLGDGENVDRRDRRARGAAGQPGAKSDGAAADEGPAEASTGPEEGGWTTYKGSPGFQIDHPPDWEVVEGSVDADSVDFRDPVGDRYLRLDWTDSPGPDAAAAWEDSSESFGASHEGYEEIRIDETEFAGSDNAAEWEFVWTEGGVELHAVNLGFVTADEAWGFALNWVAHEEVWEESLAEFESFKASFHAP